MSALYTHVCVLAYERGREIDRFGVNENGSAQLSTQNSVACGIFKLNEFERNSI